MLKTAGLFQRSLAIWRPRRAVGSTNPRQWRTGIYPPASAHNDRGIEKVPGTELLMDARSRREDGMPGRSVLRRRSRPMQLTQDNRGEPPGPSGACASSDLAASPRFAMPIRWAAGRPRRHAGRAMAG